MKKYFSVFKISIQDALAYRFNFFVHVVTQMFVWLAFVYLWLRIYSEGKTVGGYSLEEMITYFTITSIFKLLINNEIAWDIGDEIREGRISNYLVRPLNYRWYHFFQLLGSQLINSFFVIFIVLAIYFFIGGLFITPVSVSSFLMFLLLVFGSFMINFLISYSIGLATFKFHSPIGLIYGWQVISDLLSGVYMPLSLLPSWFISLSNFLPFQYINYYPIRYYLEKTNSVPWEGLLSIMFWIAAFFLVGKFIWYLGSKKYEAFGR